MTGWLLCIRHSLIAVSSDDLFSVAKADVQVLLTQPDAADLLALKVSNAYRVLNEERTKRQNMTRMLDGSALMEFDIELKGLRLNNQLLAEAMAKLKGDTDKEAKKKDEDYSVLMKENEQLKKDHRDLLARHEKLEAEFTTLKQSQFTPVEVAQLRKLLS